MSEQLAATIAGLLRASRSDGAQRSHKLGSGLQLRVGTAHGDEFIALTRGDRPSDMTEAATVAAQAGWLWYAAEWQTLGGVQYIVIRPTGEPPDEPDVPVGTPRGRAAAAQAQAGEDPENTDPPDAQIRALLDHPGPWQDCLTLRDPQARAAYLRTARRCQLRDMLAWATLKFPAPVQAFMTRRGEQARVDQLREGVRAALSGRTAGDGGELDASNCRGCTFCRASRYAVG